MSGRIRRLLRGLLVPGSIRARESERWCTADPFPSGSYNFQFLRSRADGDFVRHPDLLWSPNPYWTARAGLNAHVRELADRLGGAVYSDALIVLHPRDFARTGDSMLESWEGAAREELADCFERLLDSQGLVKAVPGRPFHLSVLPDGHDDLGVRLGLQPGEFATAMLPNLYLGAAPDSAPLVEVFVSEGDGRFASVGTLHSDQLAFTVGAHALDNHTRPELGDSALYTVHRFPDRPGIHHKLGGERAERLAIETGRAHGGETIQVVDKGRDKLLLEVMLVAARAPESELPLPGERAGRLNGAPVALDLPFGPVAGTEMGTILPEDLDLNTLGAFSIIPDSLPERIHTLTERGALLQRIHFDKVMSGYTMELDRGGHLSPRAADPVGRFEVRGERVSIAAVGRELSLDGEPLKQGESRPLPGPEHRITWRDGDCSYTSMRRKDRRWPYLGRVGTPRRSTPLAEGDLCAVGRDHSDCDVALPDRMTTDNILWKGQAQGSKVEVRGGKVPRSRFRTDAIFVASRAAEIDLSGEAATLRNPSTSCPVHVLRADGQAVRVKQGGGELALEQGDELLIGNLAFALLAPGEEERSPRPDPETTPMDLASLPERLRQGRGRRPRVGGQAGKLVEPSRTYSSMLGISPAGDRAAVAAPVAAPPPMPAARPAAAPSPPTRVPTECCPSLSLDEVTVDDPERSFIAADDGVDASGEASFMDADGDDWLHGGEVAGPLDGAVTVVDEEPDWQDLMAAAEQVTREQPAVPAPAPTVDPDVFEALVELVDTAPRLDPVVVPPPPPLDDATVEVVDAPEPQPEPPPARRPRGLAIPVRTAPAAPPPPAFRRRAATTNLPSFGPMPLRRRGLPAFPPPSLSGD
jgi:hypothetical protein